MNKTDKIYIAGHKGMVGSAILRKLKNLGFDNLIYRSSKELDLRDQSAVQDFFVSEKPDYVFLSAAKVGGIIANNTLKAEFIYDNLMIQTNVIHQAYKNEVKKLMFFGSSCIYPKLSSQPLKEEYLLTGALEPTNEPFAVAKIAGIKMCDAYRSQFGCNFISVMPTNLYGPNDNYDLVNSHVLPAMMKKIHDAKENGIESVEMWGSGSPLREFLHVDDLASACIFLMNNYDKEGFINVGVGSDISIKDLALLVKKVVGYQGAIKWDTNKPDGTPRKLMDVSHLNALGWNATISLEDGVADVYNSVFLSAN